MSSLSNLLLNKLLLWGGSPADDVAEEFARRFGRRLRRQKGLTQAKGGIKHPAFATRSLAHCSAEMERPRTVGTGYETLVGYLESKAAVSFLYELLIWPVHGGIDRQSAQYGRYCFFECV